MNDFPRVRIAGIRIDCPSFAQAIVWIRERAAGRAGGYVCHVSAHGVVEAQKDRDLGRALAGAALALPDGMPLVWLGRWRGHGAERVYGPDLMRAVLGATADGGCRHYLFGSTPDVLAALERRIALDHAGSVIAGSMSPPFGPLSASETEAHARAIRASGADVVWIGLGAPRQEKWMAQMAEHLPGQVLVGVGAAFDFLAGTKPQAPVWLRRSGLEWAFRWLSEPRRLTGRYARVVPAFLWLAAREILGSGRQDRIV